MASMNQQLQAAQGMYKLHTAAAGTGIDVAGITAKLAQFDPKNPLALCEGRMDGQEGGYDDDEDSDDKDEVHVAAPSDQVQKYQLKMCIHSAKQLPRESSYIRLEIQSDDGNLKLLTSETAQETDSPVWEFNVDEIIEVGSAGPNIEIQVYGRRGVLNDVLLGAVKVPFKRDATWSTRGVKRQELRAKGSQAIKLPGQKPQAPKIKVCWQLATPGEPLPDLNRIAEMDHDALDKKAWYVDVKVCKVKMKKTEAQPRPLTVKLECFTSGKGGGKHQISPAELTQEEDLEGRVKSKPIFNEAKWFEEKGWSMEPWPLGLVSHVDLLSYNFRATVRMMNTLEPPNNEEKKYSELDAIVVGVYEEGLAELLESIEEHEHKLWFDGELKSKSGISTGQIRLEVDIYSGAPHKPQRDQIQKQFESAQRVMMKGTDAKAIIRQFPAPKINERQGLKPNAQREGNRQVNYYCSIFADNLPFVGDECDPYVKIIMGTGASGRNESKHKTNCVYDVEWEEPIKIQCKALDRKAKIELWNDNNFLFGRVDELVGEISIYDVSPGQTYWRHIFGGAIGQGVKKDEAMQMTRGAIKPASTYHGSIAIHFGNRPKVPNGHFAKLRQERSKVSLAVRLYRGLYLDRYVDQSVTVLVQLPGARFTVDEPPAPSKEKTRPSNLPREKDTQKKPWAFNHCVLSFLGHVDSHGVLRFSPGDQASVFTHTEKNKKVAWVERCTPMGEPFFLPPGVTHCYLYIVGIGEEELPPQVFGRLRLQQFDTDPMPKWKRMRYDESVTEIPESLHRDDLAGFLLGTAVLIRHPKEAPKETGAEEKKDTKKDTPPPPILKEIVGGLDLKDDIKIVRSPGDLNRVDMIPKTAKPSSILCRPCVGHTYIHVGSPGDFVRFRYEREDTTGGAGGGVGRREVFAHVDVLAARSLHAMDDDGLADPCYGIRIEDKVLMNSSIMKKSLDPLWTHRYVIPIKVECELDQNGVLTEEPSIPLPPIVFVMMDKDPAYLLEKSEKILQNFAPEVVGNYFHQKISGSLDVFGTNFQQMCKFVVKYPQILDAAKTLNGVSDPHKSDRPKRATDELKVNQLHEAEWQALDQPGKTPFDGEQGGVDPAWRTRPRALVASGYSVCRKVAATNEKEKLADYGSDGFQLPFVVEKNARYKIFVDLLGLRNMPASAKSPKLDMRSFWRGRTSYEIFPEGARNPNFFADIEDPNMETFRNQVEKIIRITGKGRDDHEGVLAAAKAGAGAAFGFFGGVVDAVIPDAVEDFAAAGVGAVTSAARDVSAAGLGAVKDIAGAASGALSGLMGTPRDKGGGVGSMPEEKKDGMIIDEDSDLEENREVDIEDILGRRVVAPIYVVPIIPYLQKIPKRYGTSHSTSGLLSLAAQPSQASQAGGKNQSKDPFVLMPDLVLQLFNHYTGSDYGTKSLTLPLYGMTPEEADKPSWAEVAVDHFEKMKNNPVSKNYDSLKMFQNMAVMEDAYDIFVDVLAAKTGYLRWNEKTRMGRALRHQELFTISDWMDEPDSDDEDEKRKRREKNDPLRQYFNCADWIISDPQRYATEPFDERVTPTLRCAKLEKGAWTSLRNEMQNKIPIPPSKVVKACPDIGKQLGKDSEGRPKTIKEATTKELFRAGMKEWTNDDKTFPGKKLLRQTSHLAVPEIIKEESISGSFFGDDRKIGKSEEYKGLDLNTHTFFRGVGHQIRENNRDSRYLARLLISWPNVEIYNKSLREAGVRDPKDDIDAHHTLQRQQLKTQENTKNYLTIKFFRPGTVVWAAPEAQDCWATPGQILFAVKLQEADIVVPVAVPSFDLRFPKETFWYVKKTCVQRWRNLENRIKRNLLMQQRKQGESKTSDGGVLLPPPSETEDEDEKKRRDVAMAEIKAKEIEHRRLREDRMEDDKLDKERASLPGFQFDGYSQPIHVAKHAFVLRIMKKSGTNHFDRERTKNWYRTVLSSAYAKELEGLPTLKHAAEDIQLVRNFFFSRFMNLRESLVSGEVSEHVGLVKGHVTVHKLKPEEEKIVIAHEEKINERKKKNIAAKALEDTSRAFEQFIGSGEEEETDIHDRPLQGIRPIQNLWIRQEVQINIYVLTARNLKLDQSGGSLFEACTPFLTCEIIGMPEQTQTSQALDGYDKGANAIDFYHHFSHNVALPGPSTLRIQVKNKGNLLEGAINKLLATGDKVVGAVDIDLEDRNFVKMQKNLRAMSSAEYIKRQICLQEKIYVKKMEAADKQDKEYRADSDRKMLWLEPQGVGEHKSRSEILQDKGSDYIAIPARVCPQDAMMPIETKELYSEDEETGTNAQVGFLRFWIDITPAGAEYFPAKLANESKEFEVRIVIYDIKGISVFCDLGERNDVYVKAKLKSCGPLDASEAVQEDKTDTHKWARDTASFNWRMIFKLKAPAMYCGVEFTMFDADRISEADPIYDTKQVNLDHMLMLAFTNAVEGKESLGVDRTQVIFDAYPKKFRPNLAEKENAKQGCLCCRRNVKPITPGPATMEVDIQILPVNEAILNPVEHGLINGQVPTGRLSAAQMVQNPKKTLQIILGRSNFDCLVRSIFWFIIFLFLLSFLVISFLLFNTYLAPIVTIANR